MTYLAKSRPHLVERAVVVLGLQGKLDPANPASVSADALSLPPAEKPIIGLEALQRAGLSVGIAGAVRSRIAEEINVVKHQLQRTLRGIEPAEGRAQHTILVTSARPGEGKTFIALNLAASIASGGTPVLLVDADGKRGALTDLFGMPNAPGLCRLALDPDLSPTGLVLATAEPHLSFLSYGSPLPNTSAVPPATMVAAATLRLAAALPDHVVVLDSPPCLSASEPSTFATVVGQVLMVIEAERTQRDEVEASLDLVDACPVLQLMLNRARTDSGNSFGSYGYGAYGAHHDA